MSATGVNASLAYNISSPKATDFSYSMLVLGKPKGKKSGPFNPLASAVRVGLWKGAKGKAGVQVADRLPGKWVVQGFRNREKVFSGKTQLEPEVAAAVAARPQDYYLQMSWPPAYAVDWWWTIRGQLG